jgi:hypothetical protein
MPPARSGTFSTLRRSRGGGIAFFIGLLLLMGGERRLAEIHFNLRPAEVGLESDDVLDGDEIRVRLVALNDDQQPTLFDCRRLAASHAVHAAVQRCPFLALGRPAPRGPPVMSSALA